MASRFPILADNARTDHATHSVHLANVLVVDVAKACSVCVGEMLDWRCLDDHRSAEHRGTAQEGENSRWWDHYNTSGQRYPRMITMMEIHTCRVSLKRSRCQYRARQA